MKSNNYLYCLFVVVMHFYSNVATTSTYTIDYKMIIVKLSSCE